jgi:anti-sigma B factor antagonist
VSDTARSPRFDWTPFHCEVVPDGDVVHVRPFGELDIATAPMLAAPLTELSGNGHAKLVLDLSGLTFVDSSGMRAIVEARHVAASRRIELEILPGPPSVQRAFEVAGLGPMLFA